MSEGATEVEPFNPHVDFDNTYPFSGEFAHVRVNFDDLRRDAAREAVEQGISEETARNFMDKTRFFIEPQDSYFARKFSGLDKVRLKIAKASGQLPTLMGLFNNGNDGPECLLDVEKIVQICSSGKFPHIKFPDNAPLEAREMALRLVIEETWRHEREHLIQQMDPDRAKKTNNALERGQKKSNKYRTAVAALGGAGSAIALAGLIIPEFKTVSLEGSTILIGLSSLALAKTLGIQEDVMFRSDHEREAYEKMKYQTGSPPISVDFEAS